MDCCAEWRSAGVCAPAASLFHPRSTSRSQRCSHAYLVPAQAGGQFISLVVYGLIARWYVAPWLGTLKRKDAIIALLWVHVFRYVALLTFSAQRDGFPISDAGVRDIVIGDLAGAGIALAAIVALRYRVRIGIALAWLLVAETVFDTATNISGGIREHLMGAAGGVTWLILTFYVPLVIVSLVLLASQLYRRRGETLDPVARREVRAQEAAALAAS
jgi:hypothetical protein